MDQIQIPLIGQKIKDNKYFQYSVTVALNHEDIGKRKHPKRIEKIKSYKNLE